MSKSDDIKKMQETLEKAGFNPEDWEIVYKKELTIRKPQVQLPIQAVMPPFPKLGPCPPKPWEKDQKDCPLCDFKLAEHRRVDYLVQPPHVQQIFEVFTQLQNKHDTTKTMYFKLATQGASSVLSQKEMVLLLKELALQNPWLSNQFTRLFAYYIPAESFHYEINNLSQVLLKLVVHFKALNEKYTLAYYLYRNLYREEDENVFMQKFREAHEQTASLDYDDLQTRMYEVSAKILAYEKLVKKFTEMPRYAKLKSSLSKREVRQPPVVFPGYGFSLPSLTRRRRVEV